VLTEGLGAGANPDVGSNLLLKALLKSKDVGSNTKMVLSLQDGWGTGTGAAPVITIAGKRNSYCGYCNTSVLI
jgi:cell division protein FtsZ